MGTLFSFVYDYAALCAALVAFVYAALVLHGCLFHGVGVDSAHADLSTAKPPAGWVGVALFAVATGHTALLLATVWVAQPSGGIALNLGFAQALSLVTCVGVWLFIIESRWVAIDGLRPLALALPAVAVVLAAVIAPVPVVVRTGAALHVLVAIAAHGVALLAAGHGLLLLALNRVLKNGATTGWALALARQCPPLVVLERVLIRLSVWVAALLAATVALGWWGGVLRLDHKTVLTVLSLLSWLAVPWGYTRRGWRGATLCCTVWVATGLLLLAYIGSRFVLQALLHRM